MTEPDQKPTLDYGRPDPPRNPRKGLPLDITINVVIAAGGLAFLAIAAYACYGVLELYESTHEDYTRPVKYAVFFAVCGSLLLWVGWRNLRRLVRELKCD